MKTNLRIGEVLMERNYITQEQMEQALAYQKEHREKRVGQILIELGFVTETQVLEALAARLGLEIVSIGQMQVDLTAVRMIPRELAEKQNLLAVGFADKSLEVVTNDPLNYFAFEEVRQLTGCQVVIRLSEMGPLQSAIRYYYAEVGAQQAAQTANEDFAERNVEMLQVEESESGDPEAPIVIFPALQLVYQQILILPVGFAYLPFHPVALHRPLEAAFRYTDQYGSRRLALFDRHIYNAYRKDGKRLRNTAFKHLSDQNFTIQPFGFAQSIYTHSVYLLFSLINMSSAAVIDGACTVGASRSRRSPASRTACAVVEPNVPILISFWSKSGKFFFKEVTPAGLKNTNMS